MVLRGGLLTQFWVGSHRRATRDSDFLGLYPRDLGESIDRVEDLLSAFDPQDEVFFDLKTIRSEIIWQETAFPGHRLNLSASVAGEGLDLQIDIGFGDPLVPQAGWIDYPALVGPPIRVQAVKPELLVAWKLDGLVERGIRRWQAKDLFDLYLLTSSCVLDHPTLAEAIRVAFTAHADPLHEVPSVVYSGAFWRAEAARIRWEKFRDRAAVPVPENLAAVASAVASALRPALTRLLPLPAESE